MAVDIDRCVAEVLDIGHCVVPGLFPQPAIDELHEAFLPLLADVKSRIPAGNRGPNRWAVGLPFAPPFYHSAFFSDDTVVQIVGRILGEDMFIRHFGTDTPVKGSQHQDVHRDVLPLFPEEARHPHPPATLSVRFTTVDVTPENGPYDTTERTHDLSRDEALEKVASGEIPIKPVFLKAGDVLITDPRTLHRGTPNHTDAPRPFLVIVYNRSWYDTERRDGKLEANEDTPLLMESFYRTLSPLEQQLLRRVPRTAE